MDFLGRRARSDGSLLAEAKRRQLANAIAHEQERAANAALLAPLYFELEQLLAPLRVTGFAERSLPICGWLAETKLILHDDHRRKERNRLLAERTVRQPRLAFDAGNGIVLALAQGSGHISRLYRRDHGMLQPYGIVRRLEELASTPTVVPRTNICVLVPRAEAYVLFSGALDVSSADRNALAERMRVAISSARRWRGDFDPRDIYEPGDVVQTGGALLILLSFDAARAPEWVQVYDSQHTVRAETNWAPHRAGRY
jgi:hypothetical protein